MCSNQVTGFPLTEIYESRREQITDRVVNQKESQMSPWRGSGLEEAINNENPDSNKMK